jgi:AraC-like DNA-binding protein
MCYQDSLGAITVPAGRFLVTDMSRPLSLEMGRFASINFRLPRAAVARSVHAWPSRVAARMLPASPLVSLLFDHLARFAEALPVMDDAARQVALDATAEFAVATLRLATQTTIWDEDARWSGLWLAAERFIARELHRTDLGPAALARALRCSRTQLYRVFARRDVSVMDHIREKRLRRCRDMLADPDCRLPIAEIASLCGMDNPAAFSRGFRRRFGRTPGEIRREARSARG